MLGLSAGADEAVVRRVQLTLVRDGTRLKIAEVPQNGGCYVVVTEYVKDLLEMRRAMVWGPWLEDKQRGRKWNGQAKVDGVPSG